MTSEKRLEALEAELAGLKQSVQTRRLEIVDENGKVRAVLGVVEGVPVLSLLDEKSWPRASLTVAEAGLGLSLYDEKGEIRAGLTVVEGVPALGLFDEKGAPCAWLTVGKYGARLHLVDKKGKRRAL